MQVCLNEVVRASGRPKEGFEQVSSRLDVGLKKALQRLQYGYKHGWSIYKSNAFNKLLAKLYVSSWLQLG